MEIIQGMSFSVPLGLPADEAVDLQMLWMPLGVFTMVDEDEYCPFGETKRWLFEAAIRRGFWLGRYLVTQAQWQAVMHNNPSHFREGGALPVENISWHQAKTFCNQLTRRFREHLPETYAFNLPTEVQWEYACRTGGPTACQDEGKSSDILSVAWCRENSSGHTHPVGKKEPNAWGLYDMQGNVTEWCYDSPSDYPETYTEDWIGQGDGAMRVIRGGGWGTTVTDESMRCDCRGWVDPNVKRPWFGFRLSLWGGQDRS